MAASVEGVFAGPRGRLSHLRGDLIALGRAPSAIDALPACSLAAGLAAGKAGRIGSLYVMEGSTLGGQVIGKALAGAAWAPEGGLTYFNPYGKDTAAQWRGFIDWAESAALGEDHDQIAQSAVRTFEVLRAWLVAPI